MNIYCVPLLFAIMASLLTACSNLGEPPPNDYSQFVSYRPIKYLETTKYLVTKKFGEFKIEESTPIVSHEKVWFDRNGNVLESYDLNINNVSVSMINGSYKKHVSLKEIEVKNIYETGRLIQTEQREYDYRCKNRDQGCEGLNNLGNFDKSLLSIIMNRYNYDSSEKLNTEDITKTRHYGIFRGDRTYKKRIYKYNDKGDLISTKLYNEEGTEIDNEYHGSSVFADSIYDNYGRLKKIQKFGKVIRSIKYKKSPSGDDIAITKVIENKSEVITTKLINCNFPDEPKPYIINERINKYGNIENIRVSILNKNNSKVYLDCSGEWEYKYDTEGNWIKKINKEEFKDFRTKKISRHETIRKIEYY